MRPLKLTIIRHFDRIVSSAQFKRGGKTLPDFSWKWKINISIIFTRFITADISIIYIYFLFPGKIWECLPTTIKLGLRKNPVKVMDNCELQLTQKDPNFLIRVKRIRIILRIQKLTIIPHFDRIVSSAQFKRGGKTFPNFS